MVNLKALEAAVMKVERIRDHEFCFEVDGTKICMMPLRPDQETEVQKYAQVAMEEVREGDANQAAFADFMDRMRHASLGFSIVQIGDVNLRDLEFVETGDVDEQGNPVSVPKWEAVCELVSREWSRLMLSQVFGKFGEMLDRLELRAQKAVSFDPVDLDEEIERTQRRLGELQDAKKRIKAPTPDALTRQQQEVVKIDKAAEENRNMIRRGADEAQVNLPQPEAPQERSAPEPTAQAPQPRDDRPQPPQSGTIEGRQSPVPQSAPPQERPAPAAESQIPQQETTQQQPPQQFVDERGIPLPNDGDSFFDPSDPDAALAAETHRLQMFHAQNQERKRQQAEQARAREAMGIPNDQQFAQEQLRAQQDNNRPKAVDLSRPVGNAVQSVRQAANVHNAVADPRTNSVVPGRPRQQVEPTQQRPGQPPKPAQLHGKPVYKMPTQTLDRPENQRQHGEPAPGPVQVNPSAGGRNPNFVRKG